MSQRDELMREIGALSDVEAVRALTVLVEDRGLLSSASELDLSDDELKDALDAAGDALKPAREQPGAAAGPPDAAGTGPGAADGGAGGVARAVLEYAALGGDGVVAEAVEYARSPMERFDPVSLSVGVLAVTLLQTEVVVKRDARGKWSATVHKRALKDAALVKVLTALLAHLTGGK
ncbi:hypothetical protein [Streptomyces sp. 8L]|uniref:hypothetical protein n=1 Tax=Streptomyces sp. 8L TaxID=2877242 RepID=UPI001CD3A510|nr:hypothetical protein [Streptomyces sp. 8L]MCA1220718.1 hypothetical protein [Streptomyces sp. 8L]